MSRAPQDPTQAFGDVRALMQRPPDHVLWGRLVELCSQLPAQGQHELFLYVRAHLKQWPAHLKTAPEAWLESLRQTGIAHPLLSACTRLVLNARSPSSRDASEFVDHPNLFENLHILEAPYTWKSPMEAINFLMAPWCSTLSEIDIRGNPLGGEGLTRWTMLSSQFPALRGLNLRNTALRLQSRDNPLALLRFLQTPMIQNIRFLDLSSNEFGWGACEALAQGLTPRAKLEELKLERCDLVSQDMVHLGKIINETSNLKRLDIQNNHLGEELLEQLFATCRGASLQHLDLRGNTTSLNTINMLASSLELEALTLGLASTSVAPDETLDRPCEGLQHLSIHGDVRGVWQHLFEDVDILPDLTHLELMRPPVQPYLLDELLYFVQESGLKRLHIHGLIACEELCHMCRDYDPTHLEHLELTGLRGEQEWKDELFQIDWIAAALEEEEQAPEC